MSNHSLQDELPTRSTTNTHTFLDTCVLDADHKALKEHLGTNAVQQNDLDGCLLHGLQIVQQKKRELSHVAPVLTVLLQSGAKWKSDDLLDEQKTPLHIICESLRDHHQLLDLMINLSQQTIIDQQDSHKHTAMMYSVKNSNINCLKSLIIKGADVTIGIDVYLEKFRYCIDLWTPMMEAIYGLSCNHTSTIMYDSFELLLDAAVDQNKYHFRSCTDYIIFATIAGNVNCINKLINQGAPLNSIANNGFYVWAKVARKGDVELLKCMFNRGIDKDSIDQYGYSILWYVVKSGNIEAVRYLLDIGVAIPKCALEEREVPCEQCNENRLIIYNYWNREDRDPYMRAIYDNQLEIVKLLDEYGIKSCKSFYALRCAVTNGSVDVVSYLLNKYSYPINIEYIKFKYSYEEKFTLLTEPVDQFPSQITKLLLDHGADPAKQMCGATSSNAIMKAIYYESLRLEEFYSYTEKIQQKRTRKSLKAIPQYIRSGVDINLKSWDSRYGRVSPFQASVLRNCHDVAEMLLISGCSSRVFTKLTLNAKPKLKKLMKEWNVYDNNVIPLQQRCRCVILNHLSPRADLKIHELPMPRLLIKFLSIPELDTIV